MREIINSRLCPCCGGDDFFEVISFLDIPLTGVYRVELDAVLPRIDLYFEACRGCSLLRRRDYYDPPSYSNRNRGTSGQQPAYFEEIIKKIDSLVGKGDLIVDVGSNDGNLLGLLDKRGHDVFGVEPSKELSEVSQKNGLSVYNGYFKLDVVDELIERYGDVSLVICRHTLEHIPYPGDFISGFMNLLKKKRGVVLIEVPDSTVIEECLNFMELWDEHLYYYTSFTLSLLLARCGFYIDSILTLPHLESRNLLIQASVQESGISKVSPQKHGGSVIEWENYSKKINLLAKNIYDVLVKTPRPIYFVGASHPQCNFINFLQIGEFVDFMIDDDSSKIGKYPPISSATARIISSDDFIARSDGGSIVLTGFGYSEWNQRLEKMAILKTMNVINPKLYMEI